MTDLAAVRGRNRKAFAALALGVVAILSLVLLAGGIVLDEAWIDGANGWIWAGLFSLGLAAGTVAAFIGAAAWIDVRRGASDRNLRQAQWGAILGGIAAGLALIVVLALIGFGIWFVFTYDGSGLYGLNNMD